MLAYSIPPEDRLNATCVPLTGKVDHSLHPLQLLRSLPGPASHHSLDHRSRDVEPLSGGPVDHAQLEGPHVSDTGVVREVPLVDDRGGSVPSLGPPPETLDPRRHQVQLVRRYSVLPVPDYLQKATEVLLNALSTVIFLALESVAESGLRNDQTLVVLPPDQLADHLPRSTCLADLIPVLPN